MLAPNDSVSKNCLTRESRLSDCNILWQMLALAHANEFVSLCTPIDAHPNGVTDPCGLLFLDFCGNEGV